MYTVKVKFFVDDDSVSNHGNTKNLIPPSKIHLFECGRVVYRKMRGPANILHEKAERFLNGCNNITNVYPSENPWNNSKDITDNIDEIVVISLEDPNERLGLICWGSCTIFILNNQGTTIETIYCCN